MLHDLIEAVKSFSYASVIKGNILSSPSSLGGFGSNGANGKSNSPASNMVSNRYLSTYYSRMQEIKDYEITDLTFTIINIYKDYLVNYIRKTDQIITLNDSIDNAKELEKFTNIAFKDLGYVDELKSHLWDILYEGSYCFKKAWDPQARKYVKFNLQNPHNVVSVYSGKDVKCHLVVSRDGVIYQVLPESICRIGSPTLTLLNDVNKNFFNKKKEDTLVLDDEMKAGMPLYFNIAQKVKEYLLKEQILSLLGIKDLIQPLLLLVQLDKNTSADEGNKLALNVENMINKYSDITSILSSNFSINGLIDSLMHNIRVLPDYHGSMGNMNSIDLSKITNKIQDIEQTQDMKQEKILTAAGIPRSLFNGESTKWDAIKASQRLNSKINGFVKMIMDGIKYEASNIIYERTGKRISPEQITCNLFTKTDSDYNVSLTNAEIVSQITDAIQRVMQGAVQTLTDSPIVDQEKYLLYVKDQLKAIDPDIENFITDDTIRKAIADMQAAKQAEQQQGQM